MKKSEYDFSRQLDKHGTMLMEDHQPMVLQLSSRDKIPGTLRSKIYGIDQGSTDVKLPNVSDLDFPTVGIQGLGERSWLLKKGKIAYGQSRSPGVVYKFRIGLGGAGGAIDSLIVNVEATYFGVGVFITESICKLLLRGFAGFVDCIERQLRL